MALSSTRRLGRTHIPGIPEKEVILQHTYFEAFQANHESVERWTRWRKDHEQVKSTLTFLPDKLTHDVVIPFGSKALMKAKLVHTNEVLACLGDSWFVKQSSKQAIEMCSRRIQHSDNMLKELAKEDILLQNRQKLPKLEEAFASDDTKEIIEEYDEVKETEWRNQHRKREREFRERLAQLRQQQEKNPPLQTDDDIIHRLEELELEEELNDELERLHAEHETHCGDEREISEEDSSSEDEENTIEIPNDDDIKIGSSAKYSSEEEVLKLSSQNFQSMKKSDYSESKDILQEELESISVTGLTSNTQNLKEARKVSFNDESWRINDDCQEVCNPKLYIKFRHSDQPSYVKSFQSDVSDRAASDLNGISKITSPSDVHDYYKASLRKCQPKSILKRSSSLNDTSVSGTSSVGLYFSDAEEENIPAPPVRDLSHLPPVLCDVTERSSMASQSDTFPKSAKRPVSLFKASRQGARK